MAEIQIHIMKYDEIFTKRKKDAKRNTWFSFPNDFMTHPDFFYVTGDEFKAFIWCVSISSKCSSAKIRLDVEHACHLLRLKKSVFDSMFEKLQGKQIDLDSGPQSANSGQDAANSGPQSAPTRQDKTNNTLQDTTLQERDEVEELSIAWNQTCVELPKVIQVTDERRKKARTRLKEASFSEWVETFVKISQTPFLCGHGNKGWKANFDWIIQNESNRISVMEGKYDAGSKSSETQKTHQITDQRDRILKGAI